ncbi:MAG TPA: D-alanine--D-alanine ligase [Candidatus Avacidaminococcus intestinavium]|uniref:D-alanine--D-alanine ligase n=1 Tax=Candidatus Avacidaminococcus intestinavium TaxID=2840684 RepID=A0A9D1MNI3_9FIRM|nr:D-alanine--D-alanine ligase [Candidatus Avacidaminococcus intestinavium]
MEKNKRVAVVMGGPSAERDISLLTGQAIVDALKSKDYDVVGIDIEPHRISEQLRDAQASIVFNATHGLYGEDGKLQGVLEMMGMPYTGSGVLASAVAMDKVATKRIFQSSNVSTPDSLILRVEEKENFAAILTKFQLPIVVKPASQGSSIGVVIVKKAEELTAALDEAFIYDKEVLIEEFIEGKELTVAVMELEGKVTALPIINIVPHSGVYDYKSKYTKGETEYIVPALLDEATTNKVQETAVLAYKALGCAGVARADIILDAEGRIYVLELNTVPGMTATSLVPKAAAAIGISFPDLCETILMTAVK